MFSFRPYLTLNLWGSLGSLNIQDVSAQLHAFAQDFCLHIPAILPLTTGGMELSRSHPKTIFFNKKTKSTLTWFRIWLAFLILSSSGVSSSPMPDKPRPFTSCSRSFLYSFCKETNRERWRHARVWMCVSVCIWNLVQQTASMSCCQVSWRLVHVHHGFSFHVLLIFSAIFMLKEWEGKTERHKNEWWCVVISLPAGESSLLNLVPHLTLDLLSFFRNSVGLCISKLQQTPTFALLVLLLVLHLKQTNNVYCQTQSNTKRGRSW